MRTNPFLDAWLFIIGSTDDHETLGAFKYVMIVLFWGLVAASFVIAFANWREDQAQRTGANLAAIELRQRVQHNVEPSAFLIVRPSASATCAWLL